MSTYQQTFIHIRTGKEVPVLCLDDYFGRHRYGYKPENKEVMDEETFFKHYIRENGDDAR